MRSVIEAYSTRKYSNSNLLSDCRTVIDFKKFKMLPEPSMKSFDDTFDSKAKDEYGKLK